MAARIMKADQRGHVIFELAAGLRAESREGELERALADLQEEYALAWHFMTASLLLGLGDWVFLHIPPPRNISKISLEYQ